MAKFDASFFFFVLLLSITVINRSNNAQMHVEFDVLRRIILEIVLIRVSVAVTHVYVFLRGLLETKMNALAIGIGQHKRNMDDDLKTCKRVVCRKLRVSQNAQMHVEFDVLRRIILEIVLIRVSVAVTHVYVFLQGLLETKMNALAIGIGQHKRVNLNALRLNRYLM
ncbi:hypothetical protein L6452_04306 [Arctium lappa]|uniref:Uncharacterized protein n=1 Tax=Arctium lappa TaxID=4217 RepID=A0ACB9FPR7_ARCLA|nr:hypothetical protein L6452_04306 [Arctium lappa]